MSVYFKTIGASIVLLGFCSCSAINPYHDDFKCSGGSDVSYCASVSDVYNHQKIKEEKKQQQRVEEQAITKESKDKTIDSQSKKIKSLEDENDDLKLIIQSKEIEKLRSDRKTILIEGNYLGNKNNENRKEVK